MLSLLTNKLSPSNKNRFDLVGQKVRLIALGLIFIHPHTTCYEAIVLVQ